MVGNNLSGLRTQLKSDKTGCLLLKTQFFAYNTQDMHWTR